MTRKDYVLLAQALNDAYPEYREPDMLQQWGGDGPAHRGCFGR